MSSDIYHMIQSAFPGLEEEEIKELQQASTRQTLPPETVICREGALEDSLYVILDGWVEISQAVGQEERRVLHHQGPGEFFGEMAIIQERPRAATVSTTQRCTLLEISKGDFQSLLERNPSVAFTLMRKVTARLRDSDQLAISDLREKNRKLQEAYERLAEQERLRSDFLTTVAHELRTPLTAAQGYLHLMRSHNVKTEMLPDMAKTVSRNVDTIVHLVNNILFLQELELITPDMEPVMLGVVVAEAVNAMQEKASQSDLSLKLEVASDLPVIQGDEQGLERAVEALLDNAIKFSPEGGEISVQIKRCDGAICVAIADPGVGLSDEQLKRLFEPFYHTDSIGDRLFGGIGLGLPLAKQVVEMHGGDITAERRPEGGSTFTLRLPAPPQ